MKNVSKAYKPISKEFLYRLVHFFLCFIFCFISSWFYEKEILFIYLEPLLQLHQNVIYTGISEAFYTSLRLSIWVSLACSLPFAMYQSFCFFLPSFFPEEKTQFYKVGFWILLLYAISFFLCRVYLIPELCSWFLKFGVSKQGLCLSLQAKVSNYVSWSGKLYIMSFCIFQIPYGFWVLLQLGVWRQNKEEESNSLFFSQNRKIAGVVILLLCATISPPDVYSQGTIFFFGCVFYEYMLWYSFLNEKLSFQKKKRKNKK